MENHIKQLINVAQQAGRRVLSIYNQSSFQIVNKKDNSALTEADVLKIEKYNHK